MLQNDGSILLSNNNTTLSDNSSTTTKTSTLPTSPELLALSQKKKVATDNNTGFNLLFLSSCKGNISSLVQSSANADAVVHFGDFGLFDKSSISSLDNIKCCASYNNNENFVDTLCFDQLDLYTSHKQKLPLPVYVIPGYLDDKSMVRKVKSVPDLIPNLSIVDNNHNQHHHQQQQQNDGNYNNNNNNNNNVIEADGIQFFILVCPDLTCDKGLIERLDTFITQSKQNTTEPQVTILVSSNNIDVNDEARDLLYRLATWLKVDYLFTLDSVFGCSTIPTTLKTFTESSNQYYKLFVSSHNNKDSSTNTITAKLISLYAPASSRPSYSSAHLSETPSFLFNMSRTSDCNHVLLNVNNMKISHKTTSQGIDLTSRSSRNPSMGSSSIKQDTAEEKENLSKQFTSIVGGEKHQPRLQQSSSIGSINRPPPPPAITTRKWRNTWDNVSTSSNNNVSSNNVKTSPTDYDVVSESGVITIWVGNLPETVNEEHIWAFFKNVPILRVKMATGRPDKRPCAFVDVGDTEALEAALRLGGERLHGARLKVEYDPSRLKREFGFKQRSNSYPSLATTAKGLPDDSTPSSRIVQSASTDWGKCVSASSSNAPTRPSSALAKVQEENEELSTNEDNTAPATDNNNNNNNQNNDDDDEKEEPVTPVSWGSPPRKDTSFVTGAKWERPGHDVSVPGVGWDGSNTTSSASHQSTPSTSIQHHHNQNETTSSALYKKSTPATTAVASSQSVPQQQQQQKQQQTLNPNSSWKQANANTTKDHNQTSQKIFYQGTPITTSTQSSTWSSNSSNHGPRGWENAGFKLPSNSTKNTQNASPNRPHHYAGGYQQSVYHNNSKQQQQHHHYGGQYSPIQQPQQDWMGGSPTRVPPFNPSMPHPHQVAYFHPHHQHQQNFVPPPPPPHHHHHHHLHHQQQQQQQGGYNNNYQPQYHYIGNNGSTTNSTGTVTFHQPNPTKKRGNNTRSSSSSSSSHRNNIHHHSPTDHNNNNNNNWLNNNNVASGYLMSPQLQQQQQQQQHGVNTKNQQDQLLAWNINPQSTTVHSPHYNNQTWNDQLNSTAFVTGNSSSSSSVLQQQQQQQRVVVGGANVVGSAAGGMAGWIPRRTPPPPPTSSSGSLGVGSSVNISNGTTSRPKW